MLLLGAGHTALPAGANGIFGVTVYTCVHGDPKSQAGPRGRDKRGRQF